MVEQPTPTNVIGWAVVELMGYRKMAGYVTEQHIGGATLVRIDVPDLPGQSGFSQLYSPTAVYCLTPTTEEIARHIAGRYQIQPFQRFDLPTTAPMAVLPGHYAEEPDADAPGSDGDDCEDLELRPPLRRFAQVMEAKLRENDWKGGWDNEHPVWLLGRAIEEMGELVHATMGLCADGRQAGDRLLALGRDMQGWLKELSAFTFHAPAEELRDAGVDDAASELPDPANYLMMVHDLMCKAEEARPDDGDPAH